MKTFAILLMIACTVLAQEQSPADKEQEELSRAVGEAGSTGIDFTKALEKHLQKYPQSAQKVTIEKALAKAAMDANDHPRILLYGERVLQAEPNSTDLILLDRVTRTLLDSDDSEPARKALVYAKRYQAAVESMRPRAAEGHMTPGQWSEEVDKGIARAMVLEARATGNSGNKEDALKTAKAAWERYPGSEVAREVARWLSKLGRDAEAVEFYANAFSIEDGRASEADRARDRVKLGELYVKLHGSEQGLGDMLLKSYDGMTALRKSRQDQLRRKDPNALATDIVEFTIPNVNGAESLALASLKGKAVVLDFWATWCTPCRVQQPMIENVKKRFGNGDVVFLSVDADDDHSVVPPFVKEMKWDHQVYYEAGLGAMLKISSIPTIIVLDTEGKISSRMTGFIPERFEDMLTERINEAKTPAAGVRKN